MGGSHAKFLYAEKIENGQTLLSGHTALKIYRIGTPLEVNNSQQEGIIMKNSLI